MRKMSGLIEAPARGLLVEEDKVRRGGRRDAPKTHAAYFLLCVCVGGFV